VPKPHYTAENYDWHDSTGRLVAMLGHFLRRGLDGQLSQCGGTTSAHFIVLMILAHEDNVTAADMAKRLNQDPGSMTRLLDRMEAKSLIRRVRQKEDRRRVCIELTAQGAKLIPAIERASITVLNRALQDFTVAEHRQLHRLLQRMIENAR
jgi:DNA-binding MarR family transcriptional regulator